MSDCFQGCMTAQDWIGVISTLAAFASVLGLLGFVAYLIWRR